MRAQIAANEKGREELLKMVEQFGLDVVRAYMQHVQDNAEESVRRVITRLKDGEFDYALDNGALIRVRIKVDRESRSATIDFTGSSDQLPNNFNAPSAVCYAAVLYVFRTLVDADIPLNAGCLKPLHVVIPGALDAQSALSGRRRRGQRRNIVVHYRCALRRTRRDGGRAGHDEQLHVRQRSLSVLRNDLGRLRRRRSAMSMRTQRREDRLKMDSTAPTSYRRT